MHWYFEDYIQYFVIIKISLYNIIIVTMFELNVVYKSMLYVSNSKISIFIIKPTLLLSISHTSAATFYSAF